MDANCRYEPALKAEQRVHANSTPPTIQPLPSRYLFFYPQSLLKQDFSVTALLTRKTAVRGTAKIDWNDYNFLEMLRKC